MTNNWKAVDVVMKWKLQCREKYRLPEISKPKDREVTIPGAFCVVSIKFLTELSV